MTPQTDPVFTEGSASEFQVSELGNPWEFEESIPANIGKLVKIWRRNIMKAPD